MFSAIEIIINVVFTTITTMFMTVINTFTLGFSFLFR